MRTIGALVVTASRSVTRSAEFPGGPPTEGQGQDALRRGPALHPSGDGLDQGCRLARARPGQHPQAPGGVSRGRDRSRRPARRWGSADRPAGPRGQVGSERSVRSTRLDAITAHRQPLAGASGPGWSGGPRTGQPDAGDRGRGTGRSGHHLWRRCRPRGITLAAAGRPGAVATCPTTTPPGIEWSGPTGRRPLRSDRAAIETTCRRGCSGHERPSRPTPLPLDGLSGARRVGSGVSSTPVPLSTSALAPPALRGVSRPRVGR